MYYILPIYIKHYTKAIIKILLVLGFLSLLAFLYLPEVSLFGFQIANPIYEVYSWWMLLIMFLIAICLVGVAVFIMFSIYFTYKRERNQRRSDHLNKLFVSMIISYLYTDKYKNIFEQRSFYRRVSEFLSNKFEIEAFFSAITKIQETVAINHSNDFKKLLIGVGLYEKIDKLLYSFNLSDRILAMRVISYLRIRNIKYENRIHKYADVKNFAQRTEAYAAIIRLMEDEKELSSFIGKKHNLSMLDINVIVNAVIKNAKMTIDYNDLLLSPLKRKVIIGILLSKFRQREETKELLEGHLDNDDTLLRKLAWDSYLSLALPNQAIDKIVDKFQHEPEDIQLIILQNSHKIKDIRYQEFLKQAIKQPFMAVKVEAMKILFKDNFDSIPEFLNSEDPKIVMAINEIMDLNNN
jgi:hypothetical protein